MFRYDEEVQALLEYQLKPALVLDASGNVIATNEGFLRLMKFLPHATSNSQPSTNLTGKHISKLGFALHLADLPSTWQWDDILAAAHRNSHSGTCSGDHTNPGPGDSTHHSTKAGDFWDQEAECVSLVECDVRLIAASRDEKDAASEDQVRARANVRWYRQGQGTFLVVFCRPAMPYRSKTNPSPATKHSHCADDDWPACSCCSSCKFSRASPESNAVSGPPARSAADITASLIPYIMATCDTSGLVTRFSDSWYRFSGLSEDESLGAAWITAMHPDDVERTQSSWDEVLTNKLPQWSTEARFRRGSDGRYCW